MARRLAGFKEPLQAGFKEPLQAGFKEPLQAGRRRVRAAARMGRVGWGRGLSVPLPLDRSTGLPAGGYEGLNPSGKGGLQ